MLHPRILKFGGTSVADAAAVERVTGVVRDHGGPRPVVVVSALAGATDALLAAADAAACGEPADRKSTRLNSSHSQISYAVFCLKKKKKPCNQSCSCTLLA